MPTSTTKEIAAEIWLASSGKAVTWWDIPGIARRHGCTWGKVWAAFGLAEEEYGVYIARNALRQEAYTALVPIRKRLMSDGYEIVPEEARDKYRH